METPANLIVEDLGVIEVVVVRFRALLMHLLINLKVGEKELDIYLWLMMLCCPSPAKIID